MIFDCVFPGPLELRRSRLWDLVQLKYDAKGVPHSSRLHDLELDRFRHTNAFAELRAKAAVTRHFLPILADVCRDLSTGSARDLHRQATLDNIVAVHDIIVHSEYRIVGFQHRRLMEHADAFLVHYSWLARNAENAGHLMYQLTSEFQYLWHICDHTRFLSPKLTWAYTFENYVGHVVRCAQACTAGTPMGSLSAKVVENMVVALQLDLERASAS